MKHTCLLLAILVISNILNAYTWTSLGPPDVPITKADWNIPAVLSNGQIGLDEQGSWNYYTHSSMSVVDFTRYGLDRLMVVLGTGSNSDGVYFFDIYNHTFQLLRWTMNPVFVKYCIYDSQFYVGGLEGLYRTINGTDWEELSIQGTGPVTDIAFYGTHYVVTKNNQTWHSPDSGYTWFQSPYGSLLHDFRFDDIGIVYGIINAGSYSDGIWHSFDYGENWTVIEWTLHLSSVGPKFGNNLTFGWLNGENSQVGVGMTVPGGDYILINDGLPNLNIKCMEMYELINTPSFWVGTEQGAYFCTGFLTPNDDQTAYSSPIRLQNYPNPFSKSTTITFDTLQDRASTSLNIYNIRGELVFSHKVGQLNSITWNGQCTQGSNTANGIYLCKLVSAGKMLAVRSIVHLK